MVNAPLLAVTNAGTSPVNAAVAGCKNCPGSSEPGEAPSFATLLDAQTNATPLESQANESSVLSDQQPAENDLANGLIAAPVPSPEALPAALLALAANDALPVGEQAFTDDIAPAPLKPNASPADLLAKPVSPEGSSQPLPNFAENLDAIAGRIDPRTITGPNHLAGPGDQPVALQADPAGTIAVPPSVIVAQDNLAQPIVPTNEAPQPHVTPVGLSTIGNDRFAIANAPTETGATTGAAALHTTTAINQQPQSSPETRLVLNDNAQLPAPLTNPVAEQMVAKPNNGANDAVLTRPTIETDVKIGNVVTKPNGEATPALQNAAQTQTIPRETPISDVGANNKLLSNTGAPVTDTPAPVKIERNAPLTPTASNTPEPGASPEGEARPASLMQRLKPLAQAAFSFQGMENAQNSAKTLDGMAPAISMTATGDLARPSGITGLTPTSNNPALPQVPLNNIAVHIASQASAGHQRFNIRLDPPELGRIDIRLEIGRDGQTMTHLAVEKPETLDLLRQDARTLERALNNAGLDSRNGSLSFSLKEENENKQQAGSSKSDGAPDGDENLIEQEGDEPVITRTLNMSSGLDISI